MSVDGPGARGRWLKLTQGESHVCVSGAYINEEVVESQQRLVSWVYDRYKTSRGCDSYFEGGCDLKFHVSRGCKVRGSG